LVQFDREAGSYAFQGGEACVPNGISILTGEAVASQRAALDYLVYALAEFDSGDPQQRTQFPITDSPSRFEDVVKKRWLDGLTQEHRAGIETLQPYDGRDSLQWLRALRELSNPDKHRHLSMLGVTLSASFGRKDWTHVSIFNLLHEGQRWDLLRRPRPLRAVTKAERGNRPWGSGEIPEHLRGDMDVKLNLAVHVAFWQGPPVVEALELFQSQVTETLEAFKPEFQR
jgi:hypothetical protein